MELLSQAGFSDREIKQWLGMGPGARTRALLERYRPDLAGRPLAALLRLIRTEGVAEMVADFYVEVIGGPAVPAQLMVLKSAERPEWRRFEEVDRALRLYQSDFSSLTEAYSWYEDKKSCGCRKRGC